MKAVGQEGDEDERGIAELHGGSAESLSLGLRTRHGDSGRPLALGTFRPAAIVSARFSHALKPEAGQLDLDTKKAARRPHFEAGGKRRRASAAAEGAPRGAPRRTVSKAPLQAGRGAECDRPDALRRRRLRRNASGMEARQGGDALAALCSCTTARRRRRTPRRLRMSHFLTEQLFRLHESAIMAKMALFGDELGS
jgi:hypothetical protein